MGEKLLGSKEILDEIERLITQREKILGKLATLGYHKLAFGNIADAVSLVYMENPTLEKLKTMDLFLVSEIKKPKDGMLEIKFFDRLKALEKLENKSSEYGSVNNLFDAIGEGAKAVSDNEQD